jgi:hypothetical protein
VKQGQSCHGPRKRKGGSGTWSDAGHCADLRVQLSGRGAHGFGRVVCPVATGRCPRVTCVSGLQPRRACAEREGRPDTRAHQAIVDLMRLITVHVWKILSRVDLTLAYRRVPSFYRWVWSLACAGIRRWQTVGFQTRWHGASWLVYCCNRTQGWVRSPLSCVTVEFSEGVFK